MDMILELLGKTEGRDKLTKFMQYGSLFLSASGGLLGFADFSSRMRNLYGNKIT